MERSDMWTPNSALSSPRPAPSRGRGEERYLHAVTSDERLGAPRNEERLAATSLWLARRPTAKADRPQRPGRLSAGFWPPVSFQRKDGQITIFSVLGQAAQAAAQKRLWAAAEERSQDSTILRLKNQDSTLAAAYGVGVGSRNREPTLSPFCGQPKAGG